MSSVTHPLSYSKESCLMLWKKRIGGRTITNLRSAEEEHKLEALIESLDKTCIKYKIKVIAEKTQIGDKQCPWH